jgi:hypothetical protein
MVSTTALTTEGTAMTTREGPELVDAQQLEVLTGTKASTWRYWGWREEGPPSFKLGKRRVWRRDVVLAWIEEQERKSTVARD